MKAFIYTGGEIFVDGITERPEENDLILAADAGYLNAKKFGVEPQILLGDFDSLGEPDVPDVVELLRVPAEKDETDTQLAVAEALRRGATEIRLIGGLSGRLDHTLSSVAILEHLCEKRVRATMTDGRNRVRFLRNDSVILPRSERFRYFSILSADAVVRGVSAEGCKYPLKNAVLRRTVQYAVSNEITGNCALVAVRRGGVWIVESNG